MRIVVLNLLYLDPTRESVKRFREMLEKEVDMTDIELATTDEIPESVAYKEDMSPEAGGWERTYLAIPGVVRKVKELEKEGADAVVIACVLGTGSAQARQVVDIPVLDPGEVGMHFAAMLGHKFTIISPGIAENRCFYDNILRYGLESKLASIRPLNINPTSYVTKERETIEALLRESLKAAEEDDASVILLGCGMLTGKGKELKRLLKEKGRDVTVIEPLPLAVEVAKMLVRLNLKQVRLVPTSYKYQF